MQEFIEIPAKRDNKNERPCRVIGMDRQGAIIYQTCCVHLSAIFSRQIIQSETNPPEHDD